jgi:hypothetical protein
MVLYEVILGGAGELLAKRRRVTPHATVQMLARDLDRWIADPRHPLSQGDTPSTLSTVDPCTELTARSTPPRPLVRRSTAQPSHFCLRVLELSGFSMPTLPPIETFTNKS